MSEARLKGLSGGGEAQAHNTLLQYCPVTSMTVSLCCHLLNTRKLLYYIGMTYLVTVQSRVETISSPAAISSKALLRVL